MKTINLTIDNAFRSPFHWNKCPIKNLHKYRVYGVYISYGELMPTHYGKRWVVTFFFYRWYRYFSNYPFSKTL